jgi:hypothetical protein
MADIIEELDVEFMDEMDCEEFLDVPWFISWGWRDNCEFCFFFLVGMWRCVNFIAFYCIVFNNMTFLIHKWGWGWWNDFWVRAIVQKTFQCFKIVRPSSCFNLKMRLSSNICEFDVHGCFQWWDWKFFKDYVCLGTLKGVGQFGIKGMSM